MARDMPVEMKKKAGYDDYELDSAVRTLIEAEEIRMDPKKMAAIKTRLDKKVAAVRSVADIRSKKYEMNKAK